MRNTVNDFTFRAMDTDVNLLLIGSKPEQLFGEVQELFTESEKRFSRFLETSELTMLNTTGVLEPASDEMIQVLLNSLNHFETTRGAFNPAIYNSLVAAGYSTSFENLTNRTTTKHFSVDHVPDLSQVLTIDIDRTAVRTTLQLDLGGIVKGWTVDRVSELLEYSCAGWLVDAGGDIRVGGQPIDPSGWSIGIDDPFSEQIVEVVILERGGIATSSSMTRTWDSHGETQHHIIDPSSGRPSTTGIAAATVIAESAELAEVVAKSIVISGEKFGLELLQKLSLQGRITRHDGSFVTTSAWPVAEPIDAVAIPNGEVA